MRRWTTWIMQLFAFWLAVSTWVFHFKGAAGWSNVLLGALVLAAGTIDEEAASRLWHAVADWSRAVLGAWGIVSPLVLAGHGAAAAVWSNVILGALILIGAVYHGTAHGEGSVEARPRTAS